MADDVRRWSVTHTKHIRQKRKVVHKDGFTETHSSTHKESTHAETGKTQAERNADAEKLELLKRLSEAEEAKAQVESQTAALQAERLELLQRLSVAEAEKARLSQAQESKEQVEDTFPAERVKRPRWIEVEKLQVEAQTAALLAERLELLQRLNESEADKSQTAALRAERLELLQTLSKTETEKSQVETHAAALQAERLELALRLSKCEAAKAQVERHAAALQAERHELIRRFTNADASNTERVDLLRITEAIKAHIATVEAEKNEVLQKLKETEAEAKRVHVEKCSLLKRAVEAESSRDFLKQQLGLAAKQKRQLVHKAKVAMGEAAEAQKRAVKATTDVEWVELLERLEAASYESETPTCGGGGGDGGSGGSC